MPEDADQDILEPLVCFSWFDMPENAGDEMQKRLTATLTSDFPDAPEELPGSTPSLGLGQKVSSGVSLVAQRGPHTRCRRVVDPRGAGRPRGAPCRTI